MTDPIHPAPRRGSGSLFGLIVGLFLGALLAIVAVDDDGVQVLQGPSRVTGEEVAAVDGDNPVVGDTGAFPGASPAAAGGGGGGAGAGAVAGRTTAAGGGSGGAAAQGATQSYVGDRFPKVAERGVSDKEVTFGIAEIDTGPLGAAPQYNQGEPELFYRAIYEGWKRDGKVPVHGRDIKLVFRRYSVLVSEEQRAACINLIDEQRSFALIGTVLWQVGADCSAREKKTPTLTSDAVHESTIARGDPYLFSLAMSEDRQLRNVAHWAHTKKLIKGKVGVYYQDESVEAELIKRTLIGELKKLNYTVVESTTNTNQSSQNDVLAVRRFQAENVETVFVLVSREAFTNAAQGQGYRPRYLDTDHNYGTTDSATVRYNQDQYDKTKAFTGRRGGEFQAGLKHTPEQQKCVDDYKAHTGETLEDDTFKFQMAMHTCDAANVFLTALQRVGPNLTRDGFVAAIETIQNQALARSGNATFGPNKHHGTNFFRTLEWQRTCTCYKAIEDFSPLLMP